MSNVVFARLKSSTLVLEFVCVAGKWSDILGLDSTTATAKIIYQHLNMFKWKTGLFRVSGKSSTLKLWNDFNFLNSSKALAKTLVSQQQQTPVELLPLPHCRFKRSKPKNRIVEIFHDISSHMWFSWCLLAMWSGVLPSETGTSCPFPAAQSSHPLEVSQG